jgi:hypothetical protein
MTAPEPISGRLTAIYDANGCAVAMWFSFFTVVIYLVTAIGTTTHVQLLSATRAKRPLLSVDLSLCGFYVFVLVRLCFLLHLLRLFNEGLKGAALIEKGCERFPCRRAISTVSVLVAGRLGVGQEGSWA